MLLSFAIHFLVGGLTGCFYPVRALLGLVAIVLVECLAAAVMFGAGAALCSLAGLVAVQFGYLGGIYVRSALERAGLAEPNVRVTPTRQT